MCVIGLRGCFLFLNLAGPSDTLKFRHKGGAGVINFQREVSDDRILELELETEAVEISEQQCKVVDEDALQRVPKALQGNPPLPQSLGRPSA